MTDKKAIIYTGITYTSAPDIMSSWHPGNFVKLVIDGCETLVEMGDRSTDDFARSGKRIGMKLAIEKISDYEIKNGVNWINWNGRGESGVEKVDEKFKHSLLSGIGLTINNELSKELFPAITRNYMCLKRFYQNCLPKNWERYSD
ncbi:MAG: hypothetical protein KC506_03750 [Nanoarchaeota archaeon]|nr:hypothetical protein [Nanoarchaeota archaeon]